MEFFEKRGHKIVSSSSLLPKDDPSVLLTTAGMQQFKPYYTGEKDPIKDFGSRRAASIQKSFRTSDIDNVGDESHLTFFEMLGNFSFGDYFKEDAIKWAWKFITEEMAVSPEHCYVSVFNGDNEVPEDEESIKIWKSLDLPDNKIKKCGRKDNFWGPTGDEGPCGPTSEIYIDGIEVWNLVFNQYYQHPDKSLTSLKQNGVDTGMGLERLAMVVQNKKTVFETDLFEFMMREFPDKLLFQTKRIIADHIRGVAFLISDGLRPSNKEAGYVLRRLMRRIIAFTYEENVGSPPQHLLKLVVDAYKIFPDYQNLDFTVIEGVFNDEYGKFIKTLKKGRKEFEKEANKIKTEKEHLLPRAFVFNLYQSAGITIDVLDDFAKKEGVEIDKRTFADDLERHKEISRAGAEKKFGGHGITENKKSNIKNQNLGDINKIMRLHTATHLLHQALHDVLGGEAEIKQMGSDITAERIRFDFSFTRKLTPEETKKIEDIVNEKIKMDLPVFSRKMFKEDSLRLGARAFFKNKYSDEVNVYSIGDPDPSKAYSKELCAGPHVKHTDEIGKFKIIKEESSGAGIRRIRAIVE